MKNNVTLFNFSKIISEFSLRISESNSFNYNFSHLESKKPKRSKIITSDEENLNHYMKKVNINLPTNNQLKKEKFKNDFFADYNNSFANFCGLTEKKFTELYLKKSYIAKINTMGDIEVNIDNIIKNLNEFSGTKRLKIKRRIRNYHKYINKNRNDNLAPKKLKKLFKINENETNNNKNDVISLEENNLDEKNKENETLFITNKENSSNDSENKAHNKTLFNIKKKLNNISIIKTSTTFMNNEIKSQKKETLNNDLTKHVNNQNNSSNNLINTISNLNNVNNLNNNNNLGIFQLSNDYQYKSSQSKEYQFNDCSNKNNIFNFSSNEIINFSNDSPKNNNTNNYPIFTPLIGNEENNNNILSPYRSLLTPNNYNFERFGSLLSPNITINYPNNCNFFNETFNFENNAQNFVNEENNTIKNDNGEVINDKDKIREKKDENKNK